MNFSFKQCNKIFKTTSTTTKREKMESKDQISVGKDGSNSNTITSNFNDSGGFSYSTANDRVSRCS